VAKSNGEYMKLTITIILSLLVFPTITLAQERQKLVVTGSSTVAPLVLEIGKRFEKLNAGVRVDVQTGGSTRGVVDVKSGTADIGMISRSLKKSESHLMAYPIAIDGIAIIVNKANPVAQLTHAQVVKIYTGAVTDWQQLGLEQGKITVINKAEGRSTLELFLDYFSLKNSAIKASTVIGDNQQGIKLVATNKNAIGYVSIGAAEFESAYGTAIKLLPMSGIPASIESLAEGQFPLSRTLNLVSKDASEGLVKRFIDFAQSEDVADLINDQYFVPVNAPVVISLP
jgi:phosphate transport system substrate-binding protein